MAILSFGYGQVAYGAILFFGYAFYFLKNSDKHNIYSVFPHKTQPTIFDFELLKLSMSFWFQTLIKFLLSEGEKFILLLFTTLTDQGIYDVASNLGILIKEHSDYNFRITTSKNYFPAY